MDNLNKLFSQFNSDLLNRTLRDYYSSKSYMEIIGKSRNETTNSAFLAWIFENNGLYMNEKDSPVMSLLDILADKASDKQMEPQFKSDIYSRAFIARSNKVFTEKCIKDVSTINSVDRIDILIDAELRYSKDTKRIRILIENKVFSAEGGVKKSFHRKDKLETKEQYEKRDSNNTNNRNDIDIYFEKSQTERYYYATKEHSSNTEIGYIYVFLTPEAADDPQCENFIHITYQDIMDRILDPLSKMTNISPDSLFCIRDYIKALSVPSVDTEDTNCEFTILAVSNDEKVRLKEFWSKDSNKQLIYAAINAMSSNLSSAKLYSLDGKGCYTLKEVKNRWETKYLKKADWTTKDIPECIKQIEVETYNTSEANMLTVFWENNAQLFVAMYNILKRTITDVDELQEIRFRFSGLTARDFSKYRIVDINNNGDGKDYGKRGAVLSWVSKIIEAAENKDDIITKLNSKRLIKKQLVCTENDFNKLSSSDEKSNRYSQIEVENVVYYVRNQWGIGNFQPVLNCDCSDLGFKIIPVS